MTEGNRSYRVLGSEVRVERLRAKLNVDYYGIMAAWRRLWITAVNGAGLVAAIVAAGLVLNGVEGATGKGITQPKWIVILIIFTAIASVINVLNPWTDEKSRFLRAQEEHRKNEVQWDILWHRLYAHEYGTLEEAWEKYERLLAASAAAEQVAQPHRQRKWLVKRIQKRLKQTDTDGDGQHDATRQQAAKAGAGSTE